MHKSIIDLIFSKKNIPDFFQYVLAWLTLMNIPLTNFKQSKNKLYIKASLKSTILIMQKLLDLLPIRSKNTTLSYIIKVNFLASFFLLF